MRSFRMTSSWDGTAFASGVALFLIGAILMPSRSDPQRWYPLASGLLAIGVCLIVCGGLAIVAAWFRTHRTP